MIAGLPLSTWLLMTFAVGAGLVIELAFLRAQRRTRVDDAARSSADHAQSRDAEQAP